MTCDHCENGRLAVTIRRFLRPVGNHLNINSQAVSVRGT
jgi:hypothetical protein